VAQDYEKLRIIVSDNFSQDNTADVVRSMNDSRITYVNPGKRLGMSGNWEFALSHVTTGYLTFLGDDDGLLPGSLLRLNELISQYRPEAINAPCVNYQWPDNGTPEESLLTISLRKRTEFVSSKTYLNDLMRGYVRYNEGPMMYHGCFASIDAVNRARHKTGRFFCSQIPDVYSAVALASVTQKFLRACYPLAIEGVSKHSNGSSHLRSGAPSGPGKLFMSEDNIPFHQSLVVGSAKSVPLLVYESYLQSIHLHNEEPSVRIDDQIRIAVTLSTAENREQIKNDCKEISRENGLCTSTVNKNYILRRIAIRLVQLIKSQINGLESKRLIIDASLIGAKNVHDAVLISQVVVALMEHYGIGKKRLLIRTCEFVKRAWKLTR
jgi:hypothetical protein